MRNHLKSVFRCAFVSSLLFSTAAIATNFSGTAAIDGCSASLIRFENSQPNDPAMLMTAGHCLTLRKELLPNQFISHQASVRTVQFLNGNGSVKSQSVKTKQILYGTMTGTDLAIYELQNSYADIWRSLHVDPLLLDSAHPKKGMRIDIVSAQVQGIYSCHIDVFVDALQEGDYTWDDSLRYTEENCTTVGGTSGSPVINLATGKVVAVNNTGNDEGEECASNNPCEIWNDGTIFYQKGLSYAQETYQVYSCLNRSNQIDLNVPGCELFH